VKRVRPPQALALIDGMQVSDIVIENITLTEQVANEFLDGNYVGCIFLQRATVFACAASRPQFQRDAISWQYAMTSGSRIVTATTTQAMACTGIGSQRTVVANNRLERNDIGFFFCWGVRWGFVSGTRSRQPAIRRFGRPQ